MSAAIPSRRNWRLIAAAITLAIIAVLVAANAHLVYVATASQPDCVTHTKIPDRDGATFRAARSSC
jgi:hypothetical protein